MRINAPPSWATPQEIARYAKSMGFVANHSGANANGFTVRTQDVGRALLVTLFEPGCERPSAVKERLNAAVEYAEGTPGLWDAVEPLKEAQAQLKALDEDPRTLIDMELDEVFFMRNDWVAVAPDHPLAMADKREEGLVVSLRRELDRLGLEVSIREVRANSEGGARILYSKTGWNSPKSCYLDFTAQDLRAVDGVVDAIRRDFERRNSSRPPNF